MKKEINDTLKTLHTNIMDHTIRILPNGEYERLVNEKTFIANISLVFSGLKEMLEPKIRGLTRNNIQNQSITVQEVLEFVNMR